MCSFRARAAHYRYLAIQFRVDTGGDTSPSGVFWTVAGALTGMAATAVVMAAAARGIHTADRRLRAAAAAAAVA